MQQGPIAPIFVKRRSLRIQRLADQWRSDRPRVYRARDRIRRQRLRVAQDDPHAVLGGLLTVFGDRTCAVIEAPRAQGRGSIPRSPDGGNRRRPQPRVGIRSRIADRLRATTRVFRV